MRKFIKEWIFKPSKNTEIILSRSRKMFIFLPEIELGWPKLNENRVILLSFDWLQFGMLLKFIVRK